MEQQLTAGLARNPKSYTGPYMKPVVARKAHHGSNRMDNFLKAHI
jgi:hypothetical protein